MNNGNSFEKMKTNDEKTERKIDGYCHWLFNDRKRTLLCDITMAVA